MAQNNTTDYFMGKDLIGVTVAPGTQNPTTGAITYGTPIDISDFIDMVSISAANLSAMIVPVNALSTHNEKTLVDAGMSIVQLKRKRGRTVLSHTAMGFDFVSVAVTERNGDVWTMKGLIGALDTGTRDLGKNVAGFNILNRADGGLTFTPGV